MKTSLAQCFSISVLAFCANAQAQINSGSTGSDGAFSPTTNIVIDMADHPTGIYNYTSVNVPSGVAVTFIPNPANTPVVWLVQSSAIINGSVDVSGELGSGSSGIGGRGGPGGYRGGKGGTGQNPATGGSGPGGGFAGGEGIGRG